MWGGSGEESARADCRSEFWWGFFSKLQAWTVESDILCTRLIFTVDEENIKAILATQFGDYGKGEKFQQVGGASFVRRDVGD